MDILKRSSFTLCLLMLSACVAPDQRPDGLPMNPDTQVQTTSNDSVQVEQVNYNNLTCAAADEYIATHKFLTEYKGVSLSEASKQKIANHVSLHCQGATRRFRESLELLIGLGVGVKPALEISLKMAGETDQVQMAFTEILKSSYLSEYLDLNFTTAINLAYQFSVYSSTNAKATRNDFTQFVAFCKDQQKLGLTLTLCTRYAVELSKISVFYKDGLYTDFQNIFTELRNSNVFGLSVKESLQVSYDVLSYGPMAPENFRKGYDYATATLSLTGKDALNFALDMAGRSLNQYHPLVKQERFASYVRVPEKDTPLAPEEPLSAPLPGETPAPLRMRDPATEESQN